jgi:hypothetical protein
VRAEACNWRSIVSATSRRHSAKRRFERLTGNSSLLRQINPSGKISLAPSGKSAAQLRPSHPIEGRLAIVMNVRWDAVDAEVTKTSVALSVR